MSDEQELPKVGEWWWYRYGATGTRVKVIAAGNGWVAYRLPNFRVFADEMAHWNCHVISVAPKPWWRFWK